MNLHDGILAMMAAAKPTWMTQRIAEAIGMAVLSSAVTLGGGYLLLVPKLEERIAAMQREIDSRTMERKSADVRIEARVERLEERTLLSDKAISERLERISEQIGRLDGQTNGRHR